MAFLRKMTGRMSTRSDSASDSDSDEEREYDIRQARCEVHRRKIGIRLDKRLRNVGVDGGDSKQDELVEFIRRSFSMRECIRYVPDPAKEKKDGNLTTTPRCHCGGTIEEHWHNTIGSKSPQNSSRSGAASSEFGTMNSGQLQTQQQSASSPRNFILTPRVTQELIEQRKSRESVKRTGNTIFPIQMGSSRTSINSQSQLHAVENVKGALPPKLPPIGRRESVRRSEEREMVAVRDEARTVADTGTSLGSPSGSPKGERAALAWVEAEAFCDLPTNAFGKVEFANDEARSKPAKYIRIADSTDMETVIKVLVKMRMMDPHRPSLAISVIGGAKNFSMEGKKKEIFNRGLVKAAQATNAWILTSGSYLGVMKAVGEAVRDGQSMQMAGHRVTHALRCIGVCSWGYVQNRQDLVSTDGAGSWPATYHVDPVIRHGKPVSLDPNHTHFILVDDGYRNSFRFHN